MCALLLVAAVACTPIPAPAGNGQSADEVMEVGEAMGLPVFSALDAEGRRLDSASLRGSVAVLAFASVRPGPSRDRSAEIVERLVEARRQFGARPDLRVVVVVLDEGAPDDVSPLTSAGLEAIVAPRQELLKLAAHFGVVVFDESEGVVHASETVVVDPAGTVRARWPGIESWNLADLLELVAALTPG